VYHTVRSSSRFSLFTAAASPEIYTLSLHDALPILEQDDLEDMMVEIAAKLARGSRDALSERTEWVLHSIACRAAVKAGDRASPQDRKSTRLNSSHVSISYAVFCLKKKKKTQVVLSR